MRIYDPLATYLTGMRKLKLSNIELYLKFIFEGKDGVYQREITVLLPNGKTEVLRKPGFLLMPEEIKLLMPFRILYIFLIPLSKALGFLGGIVLIFVAYFYVVSLFMQFLTEIFQWTS